LNPSAANDSPSTTDLCKQKNPEVASRTRVRGQAMRQAAREASLRRRGQPRTPPPGTYREPTASGAPPRTARTSKTTVSGGWLRSASMTHSTSARAEANPSATAGAVGHHHLPCKPRGVEAPEEPRDQLGEVHGLVVGRNDYRDVHASVRDLGGRKSKVQGRKSGAIDLRLWTLDLRLAP
jgi:hypothetical protein